jgi:hypothetical protein
MWLLIETNFVAASFIRQTHCLNNLKGACASAFDGNPTNKWAKVNIERTQVYIYRHLSFCYRKSSFALHFVVNDMYQTLVLKSQLCQRICANTWFAVQ